VCSSLPPEQTAAVEDDTIPSISTELMPLNYGFVRMFKGLSYHAAAALNIPATFATAYGFIWAFGRVIVAMADSQLFPPFLKATYGPLKAPYAALLTGSIFGYGICIVAYFFPVIELYIFNICMLSGFMAYTSQFYGYVIMKTRHASQQRSFDSPLGIPGAIWGGTIVVFSSISIIGFQGDGQLAVTVFLCQIGLLSVYYYFYARKRQCFSDEEKFVFVAQLIKCKLV
jgi:amino acid transporter